jgi:hypothetical protein
LPIKESFRLWRIESHDQMMVNPSIGRPVPLMPIAPVSGYGKGCQTPDSQGVSAAALDPSEGLACGGLRAHPLIREIGAPDLAALRQAGLALQRKGQDE